MLRYTEKTEKQCFADTCSNVIEPVMAESKNRLLWYYLGKPDVSILAKIRWKDISNETLTREKVKAKYVLYFSNIGV